MVYGEPFMAFGVEAVVASARRSGFVQQWNFS